MGLIRAIKAHRCPQGTDGFLSWPSRPHCPVQHKHLGRPNSETHTFMCCNLEDDHSLGAGFSCQNTCVCCHWMCHGVARGPQVHIPHTSRYDTGLWPKPRACLEQELGARWDTLRHIWCLRVGGESHFGYLNS